MVILLDGRPLQKAGIHSEITWFIISCARELSAEQGVGWVFLSDKGRRGLALPAEGGRLVRRTLPGGLGDKLWYGWVVPGVARKTRADMVMMPAGVGNLKTPRCSWRNTGEGMIISFGGRDVRVPLAPEEDVRVLPEEEREKLKEVIAGGGEYFFADVTGARKSKVMNLLKAFSLFKKRQRSNMKLVLAGVGTIDKLDSYKYREDVCLYPKRTKGQMEAAYAVIHIPKGGELGIGVLNAWRARVPVVRVGELREALGGMGERPEAPGGVGEKLGIGRGRAGDAVAGAGTGAPIVRVGAEDVVALAEALKNLYKDEAYRNELIERGAEEVAGLSMRRSAAVMGDLLGNI